MLSFGLVYLALEVLGAKSKKEFVRISLSSSQQGNKLLLVSTYTPLLSLADNSFGVISYHMLEEVNHVVHGLTKYKLLYG